MKLNQEKVAMFLSELIDYGATDHKKICDIFNQPLYAVFASHRTGLLTDPNPMKALFTLLDKSYSAGLRRSFRSGESKDNPISPVDAIVERICSTKGDEYQHILCRLDGLGNDLRAADTSEIVDQVRDLCALLTEVGGGEKRPLSFSSNPSYSRERGQWLADVA